MIIDPAFDHARKADFCLMRIGAKNILNMPWIGQMDEFSCGGVADISVVTGGDHNAGK